MSETQNVTLGQYKGLKMSTRPVIVTEAEIDQTMQEAQKSWATAREITNRPVAMNDKITLNFAGFVNDEQFEGGTAEGYELIVGSHSFIDTFEEQLVGAEIGQEVTVNVTFPENYGASELAGKPAKFICVVTRIEENVVPALTDEFCREHFDCETVAELREKVRERIIAQKTEQVNNGRKQVLVQRVVENSQITFTAADVDEVIKGYIDGFSNQLKEQHGIELEQYCQMTGMTIEMMQEQIRPQAENAVKQKMVLAKIAEEEKIVVDDSEISKYFGFDAEAMKATLPENELKEIKEDILLRRAADVILTNIVEEAE